MVALVAVTWMAEVSTKVQFGQPFPGIGAFSSPPPP